MRKILILNGSPHREKSTTMVATNAFVRGMLASGNYEADPVHVAALNIRPCLGGLSCCGRPEGECGLLSMVMAYHGQNTPQDGEPAHTFRYPKADRRFILISGCAYNETNEVYDPILREFDLILGKGNFLPILCPQYKTMIDNGGARVDRSIAKFTAAGAEYAEGETLSPETVRDITRPPFSPAVYRTILENVWRRERESGDGIKETSR